MLNVRRTILLDIVDRDYFLTDAHRSRQVIAVH